MPPRDGSPPNDPLEFIRRAARIAREDQVQNAIGRMARDDEHDDSLGVDASADTPPAPDSFNPDSLDDGFSERSDPPSSGTLAEIDFSVDSTIELPEGQSSTDSQADQPSLSDPSPSSHRARSSTRPTILATPPFRPTRRPPMAVLHLYDDDQRGYESVRIRQTPFVIGRQDGDLVVGHERQMSRRHARIDRVQEGETWRWYLGDLRSTNGTFLRARQTTLDDGDEVLLAGELVRFVQSATGEASLVRVAPSAEEERIALPPGVHSIGSDPKACLPFLLDSPYLDPQGLRLEVTKGRWQVVDLGTTNGLWVAITKRTELTSGAAFQIGEQRFGFQLP
ncbi:FHA domain protein [Botrimarina colliarenosi]|uniref:FHA domain protein n=1 Tax=Botrimarina colliarenosi TaxID=2528001 RepID=A0A5C6A9P4_9BACT|nr:FHA domain-containing protein [Botrimarina colliarenosi]TWT96077.1 FHA domain protein [Botrimarina colliarenosi]